MANVHLHLLIVGFILLVPTPQQAQGNVSRFYPTLDQPPPIVFDVVKGDYKDFLHRLHGVLAENPTRRNVEGVPVLAKQCGGIPARWIYVNLFGSNAAVDKTTIAIRDDNIYIVGFTNNNNNWFAFEGYEGLIRGSTPLSFNGSYTALVVGGYRKLTKIELGKENMLEAVRKLALHRRHHDGGRPLRQALAQLCVMVAEAERFRPIDDTLVQGWKDTPQINASQAEYVVLWSDMSFALLRWQDTRKWTYKRNELRKAGIYRPEDALKTLGLLLCPTKFKFCRCR